MLNKDTTDPFPRASLDVRTRHKQLDSLSAFPQHPEEHSLKQKNMSMRTHVKLFRLPHRHTLLLERVVMFINLFKNPRGDEFTRSQVTRLIRDESAA